MRCSDSSRRIISSPSLAQPMGKPEVRDETEIRAVACRYNLLANLVAATSWVKMMRCAQGELVSGLNRQSAALYMARYNVGGQNSCRQSHQKIWRVRWPIPLRIPRCGMGAVISIFPKSSPLRTSPAHDHPSSSALILGNCCGALRWFGSHSDKTPAFRLRTVFGL